MAAGMNTDTTTISKSEKMMQGGTTSTLNPKPLVTLPTSPSRSPFASSQPPNLTCFKSRNEHGNKGTVLNQRHASVQAKQEATMVEARVRKLMLEEEKMLKKIEQTRNQARRMMEIHEENNQRQAKKLEHYQMVKMQLEEQRLLNQQRRLENEQIRHIHREQILAAKKSEYFQARQIKEKAAFDKSMLDEGYIKDTLEVNQRVREWKKRAKSISNYNKFCHLQDVKDRYDKDMKKAKKQTSVFEKRTQRASVKEDHLIQKLQNTLQVQRNALNELE